MFYTTFTKVKRCSERREVNDLMKPDFALSLSFEGIDLLARAAGGWRLAGHVALDTPDLGGTLTELRQRAIDLGGPAFRTKLIIPTDQIRYLSVDTGHVSTADRIEQVRAALDGATPYAVEELVYDICVDGALTHVAAVARDTLEEAEAFANEHRFQPVSFVAIPGNEAFLGEPFFGPTQFAETALASGERVEPDGIAVVIIGDVDEVATDGVEPESVEPALSPTEQLDVPPAPVSNDESEAFADPVVKGTNSADAGPPSDPIPGFTSRRFSVIPDHEQPEPELTASTIAPSIDFDETPELDTPPGQLSASLTDQDVAPNDDVEERPSWTSRFLSRRGGASKDAAPVEAQSEPAIERVPPAPSIGLPEPGPIAAFASPQPALTAPAPPAAKFETPDERARMTVFGQRNTTEVGGAPKYLGLVLTAILLLFLAGVALWASLFLDTPLSSWFGEDERTIAVDTPDTSPPVIAAPELDTTELATVLDPAETGLTDTDAAVLDALREEAEIDLTEPAVPDQDTAEARYAVTGIWQKAPESPVDPGLITLDDLYLTSIDGAVDARDAVALPRTEGYETDQPLGQIISPVGPGSEFAFDDDGRVIPTPEGALSPDGFTVVLGRPPLVPPPTPERETIEVDEPETAQAALAGLRPLNRPGDLIEQTERSQLGGLTLSELSGVRPLVRPELEKSAEEQDETPTAQAVLASRSPATRPANMASLVEEAARREAAQATQPTQVAAAAPATVAPATVAPRIPSSASVARAATVNNAINLRRVNLIGVYGTPSNRRALVRLPNGRYKKVEVGDRLDGGRISAIGESELRYQKNGRNLTLSIPSG